MIVGWNWATVLAFAGFWCYGFMGSVQSLWGIPAAIFTCSLAALFGFYVWLSITYEKTFQDSILLKKADIFIFLSYAAILFLFSWEELFYSLSGDQLSHAYYSQIHALKGGRKIVSFFPGLKGISAKIWVQGVSFLFLGSAALFLFALKFVNRWIKLAVLIVAFLICRWVVWNVGGGNYDVHPTFRLFPPWLFSTLIGINSFAFRLPQFLALLIAMWFCARKLIESTGSTAIGWTAGLAIGTIPVFWHVGVLLETSIWSTVVCVSFFVELACLKDDQKIHWGRWASLFALAILMRQPALIGLATLFVYVLLTHPREFLKSKAFYAVPVALPSLLNALVKKTPALVISPEHAGLAPMELLRYAFSSGRVAEAVLNSVPVIWIMVGILGFLLAWRRAVLAFSICAFAVLALGLFYSIDPNLWGVGRYQAEYFIPFVVLGVISGLVMLNASLPSKKWGLVAITLVLSIYNISEFRALPSKAEPVDTRKLARHYRNAHVLSEYHYRYDEAFKAAKEANLAERTALLGVGYGAMSQVIYGYSLRDWMTSFQLEQEIVLTKGSRGNTTINAFSSTDVAKNPKISLVLISDAVPDPTEDLKTLFINLEKAGFREWRRFEDLRYGSTIIGLTR
jgi:hypothetical protein